MSLRDLLLVPEEYEVVREVSSADDFDTVDDYELWQRGLEIVPQGLIKRVHRVVLDRSNKAVPVVDVHGWERLERLDGPSLIVQGYVMRQAKVMAGVIDMVREGKHDFNRGLFLRRSGGGFWQLWSKEGFRDFDHFVEELGQIRPILWSLDSIGYFMVLDETKWPLSLQQPKSVVYFGVCLRLPEDDGSLEIIRKDCRDYIQASSGEIVYTFDYIYCVQGNGHIKALSLEEGERKEKIKEVYGETLPDLTKLHRIPCLLGELELN